MSSCILVLVFARCNIDFEAIGLFYCLREAAKEVFLVSRPLRGGRMVKSLATKKKITFFEALKKFPTKNPPKQGRATKKSLFCGFPKMLFFKAKARIQDLIQGEVLEVNLLELEGR